MSTSRNHRRLLRQVNVELNHYRFHPEEFHDPATEQVDDYDSDYDDEDPVGHCPSCDAELSACSIQNCSVCGMEGCDFCLCWGDDVLPFVCPVCEGETVEEDEEVMA